MQIAFINSKGGGGNNAPGVVHSPQRLHKRYGEQAAADYLRCNYPVRQHINAYVTAPAC